jgi:pimeloyl-ACP methyl ester carboxylesterase
VPAQVEVSHAIVQLARTGTAPFPRAFSKVIYVGHSFGSMIGNGLNVKYPNDVDATVLTGFSENLITSFASTFAGVGILPASIANPAKYGDLNPCYLQTVIKADVTKVFFYPGGYDIALTDYDWTVRGTLSCGEAVTGVISIGTASEYNHPVYVINGQYDEIFCNVLPPLTSADCGYGSSSILAKTKTIYPAASVYGWSGIPDSGHCWQLHYAAQDGFNQTHIWLSSVGF